MLARLGEGSEIEEFAAKAVIGVARRDSRNVVRVIVAGTRVGGYTHACEQHA